MWCEPNLYRFGITLSSLTILQQRLTHIKLIIQVYGPVSNKDLGKT